MAEASNGHLTILSICLFITASFTVVQYADQGFSNMIQPKCEALTTTPPCLHTVATECIEKDAHQIWLVYNHD